MARNKRDVDRQLKQDEIVAVARARFLENGYDATSMAEVARAAGVAPNTLYWYFTDKDALLIAVLNELVQEALQRRAGMTASSLEQQLVWLIGQFEQAFRLVLTVHARLAQSEAIRTWHDNFHRLLDALVVSELVRQGMTSDAAQQAAIAGAFIVEGLLTHPHTPEQRQSVIAWLVKQAR